jgi:glycogen operon protein
MECLQVYLSGRLDYTDLDGRPVLDDDFLLVFNGSPEPTDFVVPEPFRDPGWRIVLDTNRPAGEHEPPGKTEELLKAIRVESRSIIVLTRASGAQRSSPAK